MVSTKSNGIAIIRLPFGAGTHTITGCTFYRVYKKELVDGALKLLIYLDQADGCWWPEYRIIYRVKLTNRNSTVQMEAKQQTGIVTGTSGVVTGLSGGRVAFGLNPDDPSSKMLVMASNGDEATIVSGEVAIASEKGIQIIVSPPPEIREFWGGRDNAKIYPVNNEMLMVNGQPVKPGTWVSNFTEVTAISLSGESKTFTVKSPYRKNRNER